MTRYEQLAAERYPIYTGQRVDPETGKPDCALRVRFKLLARAEYVKRLEKDYELGQTDAQLCQYASEISLRSLNIKPTL